MFRLVGQNLFRDHRLEFIDPRPRFVPRASETQRLRQVHLAVLRDGKTLSLSGTAQCARQPRRGTYLRSVTISVVRLVVASFVWSAYWCGAYSTLPQSTPSSEYIVKAAFLFHFAQFVEWPSDVFPDGNSPLIYCTLGDDPFQGVLDASLSGKTIGARQLRVWHLKLGQDLQSCHVLFLGNSEKKSIPAMLSGIQGKPLLTVGETEHFVTSGGIIGFCLVENKVRFDINLDNAEKGRLKISSRLLSLARTIVNSSGGK